MHRRQFIKKCFTGSCLTTAAGLSVNLGLTSRVLAQSSSRFDDNKALVCVFLYGGNDSYNLLVPTDSAEHGIYAGVRQNLAFSRDSLLPITPQTTNTYNVGIPSQASSLHQLFENQKLSIITNIGPMVRPATKQELLANEQLRPPQLFSHNDQQDLWQTSSLDTSASSGWGGRIADLVGDTSDPLSMNVSLFGNNIFQAGTQFQPFAVDESGPETFAALDSNQEWNRERVSAFSRLLDDVQHPLGRAYGAQMLKAEENNQRVIEVLDTVPDPQIDYPQGNPLSGQLAMVARLIEGQPLTNQARQIYYVGMGGWDTHDNQAQQHPQLLQQLGDALAAFQADLEARSIDERVTTFSLSEFGRTLTSNGDGTDHGWAGHQLIMGAAIKGGELFGTLPELALNSNDDLEDGRMIPRLSVEQMGASLSQWFGLSNNEINAVFPHLNRFDENALSLFTT